jgi:hypothetical protein|tara:strand:+ start:1117 stop:1302 length:186 start_codon:yes stop_codon:yes gene_type:complete
MPNTSEAGSTQPYYSHLPARESITSTKPNFIQHELPTAEKPGSLLARFIYLCENFFAKTIR